MIADVKMNPRQHEAWQYLQDTHTKEILFGGGARGGKSWFGCQWLILQALSKPGSAWLIGRNELKKLKQTTLLTFFEVINTLGLRDEIKYNEPMGMITFKKQDVVIFLVDLSYQPSDPKYNRLGSYSLTGYFIDEAQEVKVDAINILRARTSLLSGEDDEGQKWETTPKALYTCNPDKGWIYQDFWKPFKAGTLGGERYDEKGEERPEYSRCFIPALVKENTLIPKRDRDEYIANLMKSDKVTIQRMLYGNFDYDETPGRLFEYDQIANMFGGNDKRLGRMSITCDVARLGGDMCVIYVWNGYHLVYVESFQMERLTHTEMRLQELAKLYAVPIDRILVDEDGVGGGIIDHLRCRGFIANLTPISPISKKYLPEKKRNYQNLKTQVYCMLSDRINQGVITISDQSIREKLTEELDVVTYIDMDKDGKIKITPKDVIKEKIGRSPDYADALAMRMWFDLFMTDEEWERYNFVEKKVENDRPLHIIEFEKKFEERLRKMNNGENIFEAGTTITNLFT